LQNLWLRPRSSRRRRRRRQGGSEAASNGCDHYEQYAFASYDVGLCDTIIYAMKSYTRSMYYYHYDTPLPLLYPYYYRYYY
jgi:hypothetical protein